MTKIDKTSSIDFALTRLKRAWAWTGLFFIFFVSLGYGGLRRFFDPTDAARWLGAASLLGIWQLWQLWRALPQNHRVGENFLLPSFGWGNTLSILRGFLIAALAGFLFLPWRDGWLGWLPFITYLLAALSDFFDGYLARVQNHVTELGTVLDMNNDSWGVLIVTLLVFVYGQVPVWYLSVGLARYLFIAGLRWREKQGKENLPLPPSARRRAFAGVQMGFIVAMLAPFLSPPATTLAATLFMIPFLLGFLYDWRVSTGKVMPERENALYDNLRDASWFSWLLFGLRLFTLIAFVQLALANSFSLFITVTLATMLLLGLAGRLAAVMMLIFTGILLDAQALQGMDIAVLITSTTLFFAGMGKFALWSPEDWLIFHRAGEKVDV